MRSIFLALFTSLFISITAFAQDKTIKILAIGNSFSEDAIENYLSELARATGKEIVIGNMYIGGAPLELHVVNAKENKASYSYRKINAEGEKTTTKDISIAQALKDEYWDYISLQQASPFSGQYAVINESLPTLTAYVDSLAPEDSQLIYHQTWAYQKNSDHKGFANYNNNQLEMYKGIVDATKKIDKSNTFAFVVPAGTAIQNGRSSSIGDHYTRDGYHLQLDYGRFTAACTWYEKIFNEDVRKNPYAPKKLTESQASIAKEAAHKAVKSPWKISKIKK